MFKNRFLTIVIFVAVLVLTSVLTVFGGFIVDTVSAFGKNEQEVAPANYPRLAANLQTELNGALAPEFSFDFETAGNPFADKTGISLAVKENKISPVGNNPQTSGRMSVPRSSFPNSAQVMPVQSFNQQTIPGNIINPNAVPTPVIENPADTRQLLAERNRQIRQGLEVGDLSSIYSINDVRPIGMIGTGDKNKVWLYSPATKQRFAVRKGTKFRDGVIEGVNSEGVQFRRNDGSIASVRWMKNKEMSGEDADAPILRVQPSPNQQDAAVQYPVQQLPNNFPTQMVRVKKSKRN